MMKKILNENKVTELILEAIDDYNDQINEENRLPRSSDIELFSSEGLLDSLGLVNFIICIEEKMEDYTGESVTIADKKAMSQKNSPFKSVKTLAKYLSNG
tara:strand:- start:716 stop:1015 length:300 start_codon:yes stop_codon:yes gene_type:complete